MKIAIAVEAENMRNAKRMGRAPWFAIFALEGSEFKLLEMAENEHAKEYHGEAHHHHEEHSAEEIEHHRQHIVPLKGMDAVLARAVGPNMKAALSIEGIDVYRLPRHSGEKAEEILNYFIQHSDEMEGSKI